MAMVSQDTLPLPVQQAVNAQSLGAWINAYKTNIVMAFRGAVSSIFIGIVLFFMAYTSSSGIRVILFGFSLLLCGNAIFRIYRSRLMIHHCVYLFQQGIVVYIGGEAQVFPWNQIAEIWKRTTGGDENSHGTITYVLHHVDGSQVKLDDSTKGISELGQAIAQGVKQEQLPGALHAIRAGQTLTFGPFSVNQEGISDTHKFNPWSQVSNIRADGRVLISITGKVLNVVGNVPIGKVPNLAVLLGISEEMIRQSSGR
jgi:hypothetical protein